MGHVAAVEWHRALMGRFAALAQSVLQMMCIPKILIIVSMCITSFKSVYSVCILAFQSVYPMCTPTPKCVSTCLTPSFRESAG